jgi:hypothetical protein
VLGLPPQKELKLLCPVTLLLLLCQNWRMEAAPEASCCEQTPRSSRLSAALLGSVDVADALGPVLVRAEEVTWTCVRQEGVACARRKEGTFQRLQPSPLSPSRTTSTHLSWDCQNPRHGSHPSSFLPLVFWSHVAGLIGGTELCVWGGCPRLGR